MNINDLKDFIEYLTPERYQKMLQVLENRTRYLTIVAENFYDPRNISAVIRSCDAFGIQNLHIIELENPFFISRRICRGSQYWVNLYKYKTSKQAMENLLKQGYRIYFADPRPEYLSIEELPLDQKIALVFGQEKHGITEETKKYAYGGFRIPLYGFVESFNVSVAAALSMSHLISRLRKNPPADFFLSPSEKEKLFTHWLAKNTLINNILKKNGKEKEFLLQEEFLIG